MKRADLEHLIRAAATIADDDELIIVGSQAVLAQFPDASGSYRDTINSRRNWILP